MGLLAKSPVSENAVGLSLDFLDELLADCPRRDFRVLLWDGSSWGRASSPRYTLVLRHPGALRSMFTSPSELTLGEAYIQGEFDIDGDLEGAFELADYLLGEERRISERLHLGALLTRLPSGKPRLLPRSTALGGRLHSKQRDRKAVTYHYNLPVEFYALFLDRRLVYSSGYFLDPAEDLEAAQEHKLEYLCKKLRLRPGERLLDIGCGWGALVTYAAARYGVQVLGVTLSQPQAEFANARIQEAGLQQCCRVEVSDYRDVNDREQFDKVVSVGMFEHVGEEMLPEYFRRVCDLLLPGGVFLNHGIAYSATYRRRGPSFIDRYVFPDGDLVPITTTLRAAELSNFEVRDVENLREHYALTLDRWIQRLEAHASESRRITNDATYRLWRLYMAGSAHAFRTGRLNLYQSLLAKPVRGSSRLPLTRADWYG